MFFNFLSQKSYLRSFILFSYFVLSEFKAFYEKINRQQMEAASSKNKKQQPGEEEDGGMLLEERIPSPNIYKT